MMPQPLPENLDCKIFTMSDATGDLAAQMAKAVMNQFQSHKSEIVKVAKVKSFDEIDLYVQKAKESHGIILFTFVSEELRNHMIKSTRQHDVLAMDVLGPVLNVFSNYFQEQPSAEPGGQYKLTRKYFERAEAVEFTVKHDDGLGLEDIEQADILLLGISRTSKTPLSIYLAYRGFKCINLPIVHNVPVPDLIYNVDRKKLVGLTISPHKLAQIRTQRLKKLGRDPEDSYARLENIREEIQYANSLYQDLGIMVLDVTGKAIEELASDIMSSR